MTKTELRSKVEAAIERMERRNTMLAGSDNRQQIDIYKRTSGKIMALQAVLNALNGNPVYLNILAGE